MVSLFQKNTPELKGDRGRGARRRTVLLGPALSEASDVTSCEECSMEKRDGKNQFNPSVSSQCLDFNPLKVINLNVLLIAHTHARTHARTHTHTRAREGARTHAHARLKILPYMHVESVGIGVISMCCHIINYILFEGHV